MEIKNKGLVQVGDVIVTSHMWDSHYPITRVTKTLAISARERDGYEFTFKREISHNMAHPYEQWNTIKYKVLSAG